MSIVWAIVAFIVIFSILVIVHEFGHFIVAKANGIHVTEFAVGMGPKLVKFRRRGTDYVLRALPIGGACVFEEDDPFEDEEEEEVKEENPMTDSLSSEEKGIFKKKAEKIEDDEEEEVPPGTYGKKFSDASLAGRIATVLAGPVFNILLGFLLAMVVVGFCGEHTTVVGGLMEGMPAEEAGIRVGDEIISINGQRVHLFDEITLFTLTCRSDEWVVKYKRGDEIITTNVVIKQAEEGGGKYLGIYAAESVDCANIRIFEYSFYEVRYWLIASVKSIGMLFTGRLSKDDVAGPVGMAQVIGTTINETKVYGLPTVLINLVNIALLLSVNLAIMNLLPLPALDGGRFIFLLVELVIRRQVPRKFEAIVTLVGFSALILLMIFVLVNDISKFFR